MQNIRTPNRVQINEYEEGNVTSLKKQADYQKTHFQKRNCTRKMTNIDQMLFRCFSSSTTFVKNIGVLGVDAI